MLLIIRDCFSAGKFNGQIVLRASVPLLPVVVNYNSENIFRNTPNEVLISKEKKIGSFLCLMKPDFKNVGIVKGCGNLFCDSIHIDDPNRSCPAIIGGKYNTLVFQCYMRIPHSSFIKYKYSSQNLAAFFLHPAMYEVRNFVDLSWHKSWIFKWIYNAKYSALDNNVIISVWQKKDIIIPDFREHVKEVMKRGSTSSWAVAGWTKNVFEGRDSESSIFAMLPVIIFIYG